ncbi:hypothetical protein [Thalassiella azotivora]
MHRRTTRLAGLALALALGLTGCTAGSDDDPGADPVASPAPTAEPVIPSEGSAGAAGAVDWARYDPSTQPRIDALAAQGDCTGLHAEFDQALAADASTREATDSGTEDLLSYIDDRLREAGCE